MPNPDWLAAIKNSPVAKRNPHLLNDDAQKEARTNQAKKASRGKSAAKDKLHWELYGWCKENNLELLTEHKFHEFRKYRFDFAIKEMMVAMEFEGGIFEEKSGHTTARHYTKDTEKYNLAQSLGWRIIRFTALNCKNVLRELEKFNE